MRPSCKQAGLTSAPLTRRRTADLSADAGQKAALSCAARQACCCIQRGRLLSAESCILISVRGAVGCCIRLYKDDFLLKVRVFSELPAHAVKFSGLFCKNVVFS